MHSFIQQQINQPEGYLFALCPTKGGWPMLADKKASWTMTNRPETNRI